MSAEKKKTYRLAVAAMLSAIAAVLQFVEISIPIMPTFVKLDVSDLPALLGTFALGPVWGVAIELVKNLLHLPFGHSAGVGELCNFLLGGVFAFVAGLVYHRGKNRRNAAWGAVLGAVAMAAAMSVEPTPVEKAPTAPEVQVWLSAPMMQSPAVTMPCSGSSACSIPILPTSKKFSISY